MKEAEKYKTIDNYIQDIFNRYPEIEAAAVKEGGEVHYTMDTVAAHDLAERRMSKGQDAYVVHRLHTGL